MANIYINNCIISGVVFKEPEYRETERSTLFKMELVWNNPAHKYNNKLFIKVLLWGKPADQASKIIKLRSNVLVCGYMESVDWEKDGKKFYGFQLTANSFQVIGMVEEEPYMPVETVVDEPATKRDPMQNKRKAAVENFDEADEEIPF